MRRTVISAVFVLFFLPSVMGQEASQGKDVTIEEVYLQRQQTIETLQRLAEEPELETRLIVIREFEKMFEDGDLTAADDDYLNVLEYLVEDGSSRITRNSNRKVHDFPEARMLAANLLGRIGGEQAKTALRTLMYNEEEPMVLSEAVYGLGLIGDDADGKIASSMASLITKKDITAPDNNLAYAFLLSIERIAKKNNGIRNPEVMRAVLRLRSGIYISEIREKAADVFDLLKQYL